MERLLMTLLLLAPAIAWAEKAGLYIGAGIIASNYISVDDDGFKAVFEDERTTGWRAEIGYIWDLGKPGGFHMGLAGSYDNFGKAEGEESSQRIEASFESSAFSALFVIEQAMAKWADFVFKIGPAYVDYELNGTEYSYNTYSKSGSELGATMVLGFTFFPTQFLAIEIARQGTGFVITESDDDGDDDSSGYGMGTWSASLQYRF